MFVAVWSTYEHVYLDSLFALFKMLSCPPFERPRYPQSANPIAHMRQAKPWLM